MKEIDFNNIDSDFSDDETMEHAGLYMSKKLKKLLKQKAEENDRSLSRHILSILKESVRKEQNST